MKKSKMPLAGAIIGGVGVIGLFGLFQAGNKGAMLFGSLILIVVGAVILFLGIRKNNAINADKPLEQEQQQHTETKTNIVKTANTSQAIQKPIAKPVSNSSAIKTVEQEHAETQNNIAKKVTISQNISTHKNTSIPPLAINEVLDRYLTTDHAFCPEEYDYNAYKRGEFDCIFKSLKRAPVVANEMITRKQKVTGNLSFYTRFIEKNAPLESLGTFVAVDTETTGFNPENNKIIEIAAVKFVSFKPVEIFSTYLDPKRKIPNKVQEITGISDFLVSGSPTFPQIQESFEEFIKGYNIVMHNARFDLSFLYNRGCCIDCQNQPVYDTLTLAKKHLKDSNGEKYPSYALESICWRYHIHPTGAHGAESDALAAGLLFNEIVKARLNVSTLIAD